MSYEDDLFVKFRTESKAASAAFFAANAGAATSTIDHSTVVDTERRNAAELEAFGRESDRWFTARTADAEAAHAAYQPVAPGTRPASQWFMDEMHAQQARQFHHGL